MKVTFERVIINNLGEETKIFALGITEKVYKIIDIEGEELPDDLRKALGENDLMAYNLMKDKDNKTTAIEFLEPNFHEGHTLSYEPAEIYEIGDLLYSYRDLSDHLYEMRVSIEQCIEELLEKWEGFLPIIGWKFAIEIQGHTEGEI